MFQRVTEEDFAEKRERIEAVIERAEDYLENSIEYDRYKIFGIDLNEELSFSLVTLFGAVVLTFIEETLIPDSNEDL